MAIKKLSKGTKQVVAGTSPPWEPMAKKLLMKMTDGKAVKLVDTAYDKGDPEDDEDEDISWAAYLVPEGSLLITSGAGSIIPFKLTKELNAFCVANKLDFEVKVLKGKLHVAFTSDCETMQLSNLE